MPVTPSMPNDQRKSKNQKSWIHQSISWAGLNVLILHLKWRNVIPSFIVEFRQSASSWTPAACTKTICTHIWYSPAHFLEFVLICSERLDGSMPQCVPQLDFDQIPLCGYLVLNPIWVRLSNFEYWVLFNVMRFVLHLFEKSQNNRKLFNQNPISGALKRGQTIRNSDYRIWSRTIRFVILWKNVRK